MKFLLTFLFACACSCAYSATNIAASTSRDDVAAAIAASSADDYVIIPVGTNTWTNTLVINTNMSLSIIGSGTNTVLVDGIVKTGGNSTEAMFAWVTYSNKTARLSTMTIIPAGGRGSFYGEGVIQWSGSGTNVRMDHITFGAVQNRAVQILGSVVGLADHCNFYYAQNGQPFLVRHGSLFGKINGNGSWENPAGYGDSAAWYIEDCLFDPDGTDYVGGFDGWNGAKIVYRFNTFFSKQTHVGNHGTESAQQERGGRRIEAYYNYFLTTNNFDAGVEFRSGSGMVFSNIFSGSWNNTIKGNSYRLSTGFPPWGMADGTMAWDTPDLTDGAGTPGGAGDGVFESGTSTSGGTNVLADSSKNWTTNQWVRYSLRTYTNMTATSGGVRSVVVSGAGWTTNMWAGWYITRISDSAKGRVLSNTGDTLSLRTDYYALDMTGGGDFQLSYSAYVSANTSTQLTVSSTIEGVAYLFNTGPGQIRSYELRKVDMVLDDPGRGMTDVLTPTSQPNNYNLNQQMDGIYSFLNYKNGAISGVSAPYDTIQSDRNFFNENTSFDGSSGVGVGTKAQMEAITGTTTNVGFWVTDEGSWNTTTAGTDGQLYRWNGAEWELYYTPLTYPHPLAGGGGAAYTATAGNVTVQGNLIIQNEQ